MQKICHHMSNDAQNDHDIKLKKFLEVSRRKEILPIRKVSMSLKKKQKNLRYKEDNGGKNMILIGVNSYYIQLFRVIISLFNECLAFLAYNSQEVCYFFTNIRSLSTARNLLYQKRLKNS